MLNLGDFGLYLCSYISLIIPLGKMNMLDLQKDVALLFYATLGKKADDNALTYYATQLQKGVCTLDELANIFINSPDGHRRYDGLSTDAQLKYLYQNISGTAPSQATLMTLTAQVNEGKSLGQIAQELATNIRSYSGAQSGSLQQQYAEHIINTTLYNGSTQFDTHSSAAADVQGIYYLLGSTINATAVNYWSGALANGSLTAARLATYIATEKHDTKSLNNEDFVKKIYFEAFGTQADTSSIQYYVTGLNNHSETRGDVIMRLIENIRSDTLHAHAKQNFLTATHVYAPGELPDSRYVETVMSMYLTIANITATASAIDTYSKYLASGKSAGALLKMLATSPLFSDAGNYEKIFATLYHETLSESMSRALLLKAGNDHYVASALVLDAFRNGEYPIDSNNAPNPTLVANYLATIASTLGYKTTAELNITADGTLTGTVNTGSEHVLSNAELAVLVNVSLNVDAPIGVSFDHSPHLREVVLQGGMPTNDVTLSTLKNKSFALRVNLDDKPWFQSQDKIVFGAEKDTVVITDSYHIATGKLHIDFGDGGANLVWGGNGLNNGTNKVSASFTAQNGVAADGTLSANLIVKNILLTTAADGSISGQIQSNVNQFLYFPLLELAGYRGTGDIYLDGKWVATEGANVFDYGVIYQAASVHNAQYTVTNLQQDSHAQKSPDNQRWTGVDGFTLSGFADNVRVINLSLDHLPYLSVTANAGAQSKLSLEMAPDTAAATDYVRWGVNIGNAAIENINAGTLNFVSHFAGQQPHEELRLYSSGSQLNTVSLSGADSHLSMIYLSGVSKLNVTVQADFGDSLNNIVIEPIIDPLGEGIPRIEVNLTMEKGGSGGGEFYKLLSSLSNHSVFDGIISSLAGNQINIGYTNSQTLNVMGNTTLNDLKMARESIHDTKINFAHSSIDSMVTINALSSTDTITAGNAGQQWVFNSGKTGNIAVYGSVTKMADLNTLFGSLSVGGNTQAHDVFAQALAKVTSGSSDGQLQEVGVIKLGANAYVIVDSNHNQKFDNQDIIFSLGNKDVYDIAANLHYQAPAITVNGNAHAIAASEALF